VEKSNIKTSTFGLAKGIELLSDDSFEIKHFNGLTVAVLCDGVGSAKEGRSASQRVVEYLLNAFELKPEAWDIPQSLQQFISSINHILYTEAKLEYGKPELLTTLSIAVIEGNRLYGANVGDSRIYLLREKELFQLSIDHVLNEKNRNHILTKAIGLSEKVEPYYFENNLKEDDYLMLCSDGLYTEMSDIEIIENIPLFANGIIKYVNKKVFENLRDDTSSIVLKFLEEDEIAKRASQDLIIPLNLKEGDKIDGFILKKSLSQNGRTWLSAKNGLNFVMKFPTIKALESKDELNLFVREAWNAKRVDFQYFPKAIIPDDRTNRYYIIEALDGENLENFISINSVDINEAIQILMVLLASSQYLLKHNLVHGDIKPENIVRTRKGEFKIVDYGSIVELFSINNRAGTPSYLAPERFSGSPISEQSEIFSIGVTIYRLLTKKYPYGDIEPFQTPTFNSIPKAVSYLNRNVPEWLNSVILRMIHKDGSVRYKNFSEIIFDLEHSDKVKPVYSKNSPLLERDPLKFYKIAFWIMLFLNIAQIIF
jgi:serine/threonine protein phosphatase PrpC